MKNKVTITHIFLWMGQHLRAIANRNEFRIMVGNAKKNIDPYLDFNILAGDYETTACSVDPMYITVIANQEDIEWDSGDVNAPTPAQGAQQDGFSEHVVSLDD